MFTARKAGKIARSELLQIMHLIEEEAYRGGKSLKLSYSIEKDTVKILEEYGYKVEVGESKIFDETPYGSIITEIYCTKPLTTIAW